MFGNQVVLDLLPDILVTVQSLSWPSQTTRLAYSIMLLTLASSRLVIMNNSLEV